MLVTRPVCTLFSPPLPHVGFFQVQAYENNQTEGKSITHCFNGTQDQRPWCLDSRRLSSLLARSFGSPQMTDDSFVPIAREARRPRGKGRCAERVETNTSLIANGRFLLPLSSLSKQGQEIIAAAERQTTDRSSEQRHSTSTSPRLSRPCAHWNACTGQRAASQHTTPPYSVDVCGVLAKEDLQRIFPGLHAQVLYLLWPWL